MVQPLATLLRSRSRFALPLLAAVSGMAMLSSPPAAASAAVPSEDRVAFAFFPHGRQSSSMSGSTDDFERAKALRVGKEGLLWVRRGGAAYVIRDAVTLRQAEAIFEPQEAMGARQAELGARQAALGSEQAKLGRRQADASPSRAAQLGEQQAELGARQAALGEQQAALGREQARLGEEANAKLRTLLSDAIGRGVAQRVD